MIRKLQEEMMVKIMTSRNNWKMKNMILCSRYVKLKIEKAVIKNKEKQG